VVDLVDEVAGRTNPVEDEENNKARSSTSARTEAFISMAATSYCSTLL